MRIEPERLVLFGAPQPGAPRFRMTRAFVLDPIGDGATRLVARVRAAPHRGPGSTIARAALRPVYALMEHEQLLRIKAHAEARQVG